MWKVKILIAHDHKVHVCNCACGIICENYIYIPLDWDTGFKSLLIPLSLVKYLIKGEEKEQKRKKDILNTPV